MDINDNNNDDIHSINIDGYANDDNAGAKQESNLNAEEAVVDAAAAAADAVDTGNAILNTDSTTAPPPLPAAPPVGYEEAGGAGQGVVNATSPEVDNVEAMQQVHESPTPPQVQDHTGKTQEAAVNDGAPPATTPENAVEANAMADAVSQAVQEVAEAAVDQGDQQPQGIPHHDPESVVEAALQASTTAPAPDGTSTTATTDDAAATADAQANDSMENIHNAQPATDQMIIEVAADMAPPPSEETAPSDPAKESRKRVRRVGKMAPNKIVKMEDGVTIVYDVANQTMAASTTAAAGSRVLTLQVDPDNKTPPTPLAETGPSVNAASPLQAMSPDLVEAALANANMLADSVAPRVLSKHDEKWNAMFQKLVEYRNTHGTTLVPQCYDQDSRLGRWVHYQRVEYWIYQQTGSGKITPDRIQRLQNLGFEWDPQNAQWNKMFQKLIEFQKEIGHCKVPKGYPKDTELANWVRNQRLEQANRLKGKRSRMTEERYQKLNLLGFKWSASINRVSGAGARKNGANADVTAVKAENVVHEQPAMSVEANPEDAAGSNHAASINDAMPNMAGLAENPAPMMHAVDEEKQVAAEAVAGALAAEAGVTQTETDYTHKAPMDSEVNPEEADYNVVLI